MNEIMKRPSPAMFGDLYPPQGPSLPVGEVDHLNIAVNELLDLHDQAKEVVLCRRARRECPPAPQLPESYKATMRKLDAWLERATSDHAADCLTVIHGLYGARGVGPTVPLATGRKFASDRSVEKTIG
jgi:hypothetical protein